MRWPTYMKDPANYENVPSFYQAKRDRFASGMKGSRFSLVALRRPTFQVADYSAISNEADRAFAERVAREFGSGGHTLVAVLQSPPCGPARCSASASPSRTLPWTQPSKSYARSEGDAGTEHAPLGGCGGEPGMFAQKLLPLKGATDLIVLPEMFTTGFSMRSIELAEDMNGATVQWMRDQAKAIDAAIYGSVIIKENGAFYNRGLFVKPDGGSFIRQTSFVPLRR
jgi:hypothetical protein